MKTLLKSELETKLQELVNAKKVRKNTLAYSMALAVLNGEKLIRPIWSTGGSWKYSSLHDYTIEYTNLLDHLGISYERGNDAPRGGKTGAFIQITNEIN